MITHHLPPDDRHSPRKTTRKATPRFRPRLEGLEDRLVLSATPYGFVRLDMMPHVVPHARAAQVHAVTTAPVTHRPTTPAPAPRHVVTPPSKPVAVAPPTPAKTATPHAPVVTPAQTTPSPTPAPTPTPAPADPVLATIDLKPLDLNLLGLEVKTSEITVTVSAQPGSGALLGNLLTDVANLVNLPAVSSALNNVLGSVVALANSATLGVSGVKADGKGVPVPAAADTQVLSLHVAPVNLNLLGAIVTTSPIDVSIVAHSGKGLLLGNVVTDLANLLNGQQNGTLGIDSLNQSLQTLISELTPLIPAGVATAGASNAAASSASSTTRNVLSLSVPPIDLNLLGLILQTDKITVNADAQTGDGNLLGNLLSQVLNTAGATPQNLATLNTNVNTILADVVGVLNASTLTLSKGVSSLSPLLQQLANPGLINTASTPASTPVLNLNIAAPAGATQPPVDVKLLGLVITTSNVHAQLTAQTGNGQILGNLVYNVSHLLDPNGAAGLLGLLNSLGTATTV